jgi:hypothetical protein
MGSTEDDAEACGRCAMSSVVSTTEADGGGADPFAGDRIEISEREARLVSPAAWFGGVKRRVDAAAARLIHGD